MTDTIISRDDFENIMNHDWASRSCSLASGWGEAPREARGRRGAARDRQGGLARDVFLFLRGESYERCNAKADKCRLTEIHRYFTTYRNAPVRHYIATVSVNGAGTSEE